MAPRIRLTLALSFAAAALLTGCATSDGITRAEADALRTELDQLRTRVAELEAERGTVAATTDGELDTLRARQRDIEEQAERQAESEAEFARYLAAVEAARDRDYAKRDDTWAVETEAWLREQLAARFTFTNPDRIAALEAAGAECPHIDDSDVEIRCGAVACHVSWTASSNRLCRDDMMSGEPMARVDQGPVYETTSGAQAERRIVNFVRQGHLEQELYATGLEDALAAEPRDDAWASEAEALLRTAFESPFHQEIMQTQDGTPLCTDVDIECRTVTCRVTVTETETLRAHYGSSGSRQCIDWTGYAWQTSLMASLPADGLERTWILPRKGHFIDDVLDL